MELPGYASGFVSKLESKSVSTFRSRFVLWVLALGLLGPDSASAQEQESQSGPFSYTRIHADSTGASHFADAVLELDFVEPGRGIPPTPASSPIPATGMRLLCPARGGEADWHPAPARVLNVIVSGRFEIDVSDGESRGFGPGSVILVEDTRGRGHRTRVLGPDRACFAMIVLADQ